MTQAEKYLNQQIQEAETSKQNIDATIQELKAKKKEMQAKQGIEQWLEYRFESASNATPEWLAFVKEYKKAIKANLPETAELINFNRGHFYVSGFIKKNDKYVYFYISDVRFGLDAWYNNILIRTAENEKDYTGGCNEYTTLPQFKLAVNALLV